MGGAREHEAEEEDLAPEGCSGRVPFQGDEGIQSVVRRCVCISELLERLYYIGHLSIYFLGRTVGVTIIGEVARI